MKGGGERKMRQRGRVCVCLSEEPTIIGGVGTEKERRKQEESAIFYIQLPTTHYPNRLVSRHRVVE